VVIAVTRYNETCVNTCDAVGNIGSFLQLKSVLDSAVAISRIEARHHISLEPAFLRLALDIRQM
jgi:hypothetical protein